MNIRTEWSEHEVSLYGPEGYYGYKFLQLSDKHKVAFKEALDMTFQQGVNKAKSDMRKLMGVDK